MRIWFNKTFSTIAAVLNAIRQFEHTDDVTLICTQTHNTATAFLAADEHYLEPSDLVGQDYLTWCVDFCQQQRIRLFWPGKEAALISANHAIFNAIGVQVMSVADNATLNLLHNKADFYRDVSPDVAKIMDFRVVNTRDEFDTALEILSLKHRKLCIKPAVSVYGLGFKVLDTQRDSITQVLKGVEYHIPLQELRQGMVNTPVFDTLLVMEHLAGHEWSVDCVGRHGELICAVQRKKSLIAGHGQIIDNHADIQDTVIRLAKHYKLNGLFNIQFREGAYGVRLLEINPRPSGGFGMACLAGANLAGMALQLIRGQTVNPVTLYYGRTVSEINQPVVLADV
jgi:predicted ATP-grasp superfamily ATP-dependent carboligase